MIYLKGISKNNMFRLTLIIISLGPLGLLLFSCTSNSERLLKFLNDSHTDWEEISCHDFALTTTCIYEVDSFRIEQHATKKVRKRTIGDRKLLYNWHFPSREELKNISSLLLAEFNDVDTFKLSNATKNNSLLIAYILYEDKAPISDPNYEFHTWIDIFTFHIDSNQIVHYSYGKF